METEKPQEQQEQPEVRVVSADNAKNVLVNESASNDNVNADAQNEQHHNGNNELHRVMAVCEAADVPSNTTTTKNDDNENHLPANDHPFDNVTDNHSHHHHVKTTFERNHEVIVQVNEHKEKSVIEEDVISALPSVKALARTFAVKSNTDTVPEKLQRPKVSTHCYWFYFRFFLLLFASLANKTNKEFTRQLNQLNM